jgi:hypothetical protein
MLVTAEYLQVCPSVSGFHGVMHAAWMGLQCSTCVPHAEEDTCQTHGASRAQTHEVSTLLRQFQLPAMPLFMVVAAESAIV